MANLNVAGIELDGDVPDDWTPLSALTIVKCLDQEGAARLLFRSDSGWNLWEAIGAMHSFAASMSIDFHGQLELGDESP